MAARYRVISAKDFIKAQPSGEPDLEQAKQMLIELAMLVRPPEDFDIMLDIRQAHGHLTFSDVYELVMELARHRSSFCNKIAVLARDDYQFGNAKFMELCAQNRGFAVEAFIHFEKAIDWLTTSRDLES